MQPKGNFIVGRIQIGQYFKNLPLLEEDIDSQFDFLYLWGGLVFHDASVVSIDVTCFVLLDFLLWVLLSYVYVWTLAQVRTAPAM